MERTVKVKEEAEQVIMVGVSVEDGDDAMDSLDELEELLRTAGAEVAGTVLQNREMIHPGTYVGKGKVEEIRRMLAATGADGIVCDDELTSVQYRNLEDLLGVKVMDRTMVILDIFARHAKSSEGKIQVELGSASLRAFQTDRKGTGAFAAGRRHRDPGAGREKAGGGPPKNEEQDFPAQKGTAGYGGTPGTDPQAAGQEGTSRGGHCRLHQRRKIYPVKCPDRRRNPGTGSAFCHTGHHYAFAGTPRKAADASDGHGGFIRKLPHHLVEAFRSTLEEAKYADYILHVVDASSPQMEKQMYIVYQTLDMLGVRDKKIVTLFNKMDLLEEGEILRDFRADQTICISAKTGQGLEDVRMTLGPALLREDKVLVEETFGYDRMQQLAVIRARGEILREEYTPDGVFVKALVPKKWLPEQFCEK